MLCQCEIEMFQFWMVKFAVFRIRLVFVQLNCETVLLVTDTAMMIHLFLRLSRSAWRGDAIPLRKLVWLMEGRCSVAEARLNGSTHSVYSQHPGLKQLWNKREKDI